MRRIIVIVVALAAIGAAAAVAVALTRHTAPAVAAAPCDPPAATPPTSPARACWPVHSTASASACSAREASAQSSGNVVVSPLSVDAALSLVLNGAKGRTADEMRRTLGLEGMGTSERADQPGANLLAEVQTGVKPSVQVADSPPLWLRDGVAFAPAFLAAARQSFAAATEPLPNDPNAAAGAINDWVSQRTAGLIKDIVEPGDFSGAAPVILTVVNALHAKAAWTTPFQAGGTRRRGPSPWPTARPCRCRP